MVLSNIIPYPKSLIPSADHLGAKIWMRNPEVKVPSSHSAPPHLTTHSQNIKLIRYVTISSASDILFYSLSEIERRALQARGGLSRVLVRRLFDGFLILCILKIIFLRTLGAIKLNTINRDKKQTVQTVCFGYLPFFGFI